MALNIFISNACRNMYAFTNTSQLINIKNINDMDDFVASLIEALDNIENTGQENKLKNIPTPITAQNVCKNREPLAKARSTR